MVSGGSAEGRTCTSFRDKPLTENSLPGLTLGLRTLALAGTLPKPVLTVQPDSVVTMHTKVTFFCEGTTGAQKFCLYKEGEQDRWCTAILPEPKNKAEFTISRINQSHARQYCCYYQTGGEWSEYSDPLQLIMTGAHSKPSLSAQPSPVVTPGENVILQCVSGQQYDRFILIEEGPQKRLWRQDSQYKNSTRNFQALFLLGPVTSSQRWTFRCYSYNWSRPQVWSYPSDPLELLFSGLSKKPSLLTHQGHILDLGMRLTLQCFSDINYDRFALYIVGDTVFTQHCSQRTQAGLSLANFTLGYVSQSTGGQYRCYGAHNLSSEWSASSDPMDILITGQFRVTPFLSVKPNSTVHSGENVTLLCWSIYSVDTFILSKEGSAHQPLRLKSKFQDQQCQAEFSMSAVTSTFMGTYRCYASQDSSPYLLSYASAPVELIVSGPIEPSSPPSRPMRRAGLESYLKALIGVSVTFLLFLIILIFLLLQRRRQGKFRKNAQKEKEWQLPVGTAEPATRVKGPQKRSNSAAVTQEESLYASVEDMRPEDGMELNSQKPSEDDSQGQTYVQLKSSKLRKAGAVVPSVMPRECVNTKVGHTEEGRKATESEEPQDVTYAQICIRTPRQGTAAPPLFI